MNTTVNLINLSDSLNNFYTNKICFDTDIESIKLLTNIVQTDMFNKLLNILFIFVIMGLIVFLVYSFLFYRNYKHYWIGLDLKMKLFYIWVMYSYFGIYLYTIFLKFTIYHKVLDLALFFISLLPIFYIIQKYFYDVTEEINILKSFNIINKKK